VRAVVVVEISPAKFLSDFAGRGIDLSGDPKLDDRLVESVLRDVSISAIEMLAAKRLVAPGARAGD
jgi:hypothetical protein